MPAYSSKASDEMAASSDATPRVFMSVLLLHDQMGTVYCCCSTPTPASLLLRHGVVPGGNVLTRDYVLMQRMNPARTTKDLLSRGPLPCMSRDPTKVDANGPGSMAASALASLVHLL
jgi:hypothetical protein